MTSSGRRVPPASSPTVSVVIPVRDDAEALRRCLAALAVQTRTPDEVIVVENGSHDDSARRAVDAGARLVHCGSPGIPAAAAAGYDRATAEVILRLDADSVPPRHWVEAMAASFAARPGTAALSGAARFVDGPRLLRGPLALAYLGAYAAVGWAALGHLPLFGSNLGLRRSAWQRVRGQVHRGNPEVHDDFDLAFHVGEHGRIGFARGAALGISMRPFTDPRALLRRLSRGFRTVFVHWPADFPPVRWTRLLLRRTLRTAGPLRARG